MTWWTRVLGVHSRSKIGWQIRPCWSRVRRILSQDLVGYYLCDVGMQNRSNEPRARWFPRKFSSQLNIEQESTLRIRRIRWPLHHYFPKSHVTLTDIYIYVWMLIINHQLYFVQNQSAWAWSTNCCPSKASTHSSPCWARSLWRGGTGSTTSLLW